MDLKRRKAIMLAKKVVKKRNDLEIIVLSKAKWVVSACLAGEKCRYNAMSCEVKEIVDLVKSDRAISICPELLGGLTVPRVEAEIIGGDGENVLDGCAVIKNKNGTDVTEHFISGAFAALRTAGKNNIVNAILKSFSPSCSNSEVYDGNFNGNKKKGLGVTAALFKKSRINVLNEFDYIESLKKSKA